MERPFSLSKDWACVTVEKIPGRKHNQYKILTGAKNVGIVQKGTKVIEFKGNIFDDEGNEVKPEGKFLMTAETIDPYHLLLDIW